MKRFWISVLIILLLAGLLGMHTAHLGTLTGDLIEQLEEAKTSLTRHNWSEAKQAVQAVCDRWNREAFYLHITLRHAEIDDVDTELREILAYLDSREDIAECQAEASRLINRLELLLEGEFPSVKNLL